MSVTKPRHNILLWIGLALVGAAIVLVLVGSIFGSQGSGSGFSLPSNVEPSGVPGSLSEAREVFQQAVADDPNLEVEEVMEFANNYYAEVRESDTGIYAMELLIDKRTGRVYPEPGPNMMWNTKYGMMSGRGMGSMMDPEDGGWGPMMGPDGRGGPMMDGVSFRADPEDVMTVSAEQATQIAEDYLGRVSPGTEAEDPEQFYGYYTLHTVRDGEVTGMLSVNGYTGQVWYHGWHGAFIDMQEEPE